MEAIATIIIFVVILMIFWNTIRKTLNTVDKGLDTFNSVADRALEGIDVEHEYNHATKMGKLHTKIKDDSKPISTTSDVRDLLRTAKANQQEGE